MPADAAMHDAPTLPPRYLTIAQTAIRLGYSCQTVSLYIEEGRLPAINIAPRLGGTRALLRVREDAVVAPRIMLLSL